MSKYQALIFDLWGTLVDDVDYPQFNRDRYKAMKNEMAKLLGLPGHRFAQEWSGLYSERNNGSMTTREVLRRICDVVGDQPSDGKIDASAELRYSYVRDALVPRPGTIDTLSDLRRTGHKVGLISNCTEEVAKLWGLTPFAPLVDAAVLSYNVGLMKPDQRIYDSAVELLDVEPGRCLYVGDGGSTELSAAARAGMTAVLMRAPYDQADDGRENWDGFKISNISWVLDLL